MQTVISSPPLRWHMQTHPDMILTVAQMRAAEQDLIDHGASVETLMDVAGRGAAEYVWRIAGRCHVTVLCGPGNNGGDGYVIAESLRGRGGSVSVVAALPPATDAARAARAAYGGDILDGAAPVQGEVLVDCLFGSGLSRPLSDDVMKILTDLAASHTLCVAIDVPSGVDSDRGVLLNQGLPSFDYTLALGAWKYAHWLMPSAQSMGARRLIPIGIAPVQRAAALVAKPSFAPPAMSAHKYMRGLAGIVAGEMPGATLLAAAAAMHGGAGYVKLFSDTAPAVRPADLVVDGNALDQALGDERIAALLVGPGLGRSASMQARLRVALQNTIPAVCDADALVLLTQDMLIDRRAPLVVTPHEGEFARLCDTFDVPRTDKVQTAQALAQASDMVIVAKGADTVIAAPDGRTVLARPASSWLSVAGTGDVLAGLMVSRLATGKAPFDAACEAVWLHGEAARLSGPVFSAGDLAAHVPAAFAACL